MSSAWLINTETLAQNLGREDLVIIDAVSYTHLTLPTKA